MSDKNEIEKLQKLGLLINNIIIDELEISYEITNQILRNLHFHFNIDSKKLLTLSNNNNSNNNNNQMIDLNEELMISDNQYIQIDNNNEELFSNNNNNLLIQTEKQLEMNKKIEVEVEVEVEVDGVLLCDLPSKLEQTDNLTDIPTDTHN